MDANLHQKVRELFKANHVEEALFYLEEFAHDINKLRDEASKEDAETLEYFLKNVFHAQQLGWIMFD